MAINNLNAQDLSTFITKLSQKTYNKIGNQSIVVGTITQSKPGYYLATILNSDDANERKVKSLTGGNYFVGDYVYLIKTTVNSGDTFDFAYFILGKVTDNNELNETELENYLDTYFFVSGSSFQVVINGDDETISDITDDTSPGRDLLNKIKEKGYFQIEGNFTSASKDNYGLKITIQCSDAKDTFEFISKDFSGQPFQLTNSFQFKNFALDKTLGKTIQSISIEKIGDFTIADLYISAGFIENNQIQLSLDLKAVNNKNYFFNENETVELAATAYYKDQPIDFPDLQYYWYIKDKESSEVLPYVGSGWKIINLKQLEAILGKDNQQDVYNTESSSFILSIDNCQSFENIFKCVFLYKGFNTESNEIKVFNYLKEDIDAELTADKESITLIKRNEDQAVLTCSIENKNENIKNIEILTKWQAKTGSGEYFDITTTSEKVSCINAKEKNLNFVLSENEIAHKGSLQTTVVSASRETAIDESICYIQINREVSEEIFIRAILYVYDIEKKVLNNIPVAETEPIKIKSYVKEYEEGTVVPEVRYQYWITNNPQSKFNYNSTDEYYYLVNDSEKLKMGVCFDSLEELYSNDIIDADTLSNMTPNQEYYIFYSSQTYYAVAADIEIERGSDNFTVPKIARTIEKNSSDQIINVKNTKEVAQLNNFNSLTRNGASQGLFYTSEGYTETLDENPQIDKTYYIPNIIYSPQQEKRDINLIYYTFDKQGDQTEEQYNKVIFNNNEEDFNPQVTYYIQNPANNVQYLKLTIRNSWLADKIYYIYDNINEPKGFKNIITDNSSDFSSTQIYYLQTQEGYRVVEDADFEKDANGNSIFKKDIVYYEKQRAGDVYINASYIQTGTLRVGEEGNEKLYVSIENEDIKIGGFEVDDNSIQSQNKEVGFSSIQDPNNVAFWAGRTFNPETGEMLGLDQCHFYVKQNGFVYMENANIKGRIHATSIQIDGGIDGKNLLLNTGSNGKGKDIVINGGSVEYKNMSVENTGQYLKCNFEVLKTAETLAAREVYYRFMKSDYINSGLFALKTNEFYTFSGELMVKSLLPNESNIFIRPRILFGKKDTQTQTVSWPIDTMYSPITFSINNWKDFSISFQVPEEYDAAIVSIQIVVPSDNINDISGEIHFKKLQLELGETKTPWMPAREDGEVAKDAFMVDPETGTITLSATNSIKLTSDDLEIDTTPLKLIKDNLQIDTNQLYLGLESDYNSSNFATNFSTIDDTYQLAINTNNFKIDGNGTVTVNGNITAQSLTLIDGIKISDSVLSSSNNLADTSRLSFYSLENDSTINNQYHYIMTNKTQYGGLKISPIETNIIAGKEYILSYDLKILEGTCSRVSGHSPGYITNKAFVNGFKQTESYSSVGLKPSNEENAMFAINQVYKIKIYFTAIDSPPDNDRTLYIQTLRNISNPTGSVKYEVWNVRLEESLDIDTVETYFEVDTDESTIKMKADYGQLLLNKFNLTTNNINSVIQMGKKEEDIEEGELEYNFYVDGKGELYGANAHFSGKSTFEGTIYAKEGGTIAGFELTQGGLVSEFINILPNEIYFSGQSKMNLGDYVTFENQSTATVIYTSGEKIFEIKNADGGGFQFLANPQKEEAYKKLFLRNVKVGARWGQSGNGGIGSRYFSFTCVAGEGDTETFSEDKTITFQIKYPDPYWLDWNRESITTMTFTLQKGHHSASFEETFGPTTSNTVPSTTDCYWKLINPDFAQDTDFGQKNSYDNITYLIASGSNNIVYSLGSFLPSKSGLFLGNTDSQWGTLVVESFTETGSDLKVKKDISLLDNRYEQMFDQLIPIRFKYIKGTSDRYHIGFIAQDIEQAIQNSNLTNFDFAGLCVKNDSYTLRYEEFIALCVDQIQKLKNRVQELENRE